jgi:hypothetical protein
VAQKTMVVSDCPKVGPRGRQVRVEKVNESEPTEDASKIADAVKTAGCSALAGSAGREICRSTQRQPV